MRFFIVLYSFWGLMYDMFKIATFASGAKFESLFETVLLFLTSSIVLTSFVYGIPDNFFSTVTLFVDYLRNI